VLRLSKADGLVEASRACAAYDLALTYLVRALARDENETTAAKLLQTANERLKDHVAAEMIEQDPGGGERPAASGQATTDAACGEDGRIHIPKRRWSGY
jgi:hypothetical protein